MSAGRGRGAYYKARYGGRRGGRGGSQSTANYNNHHGAYKRLLGKYDHVEPQSILSIDHVQGNAYAAPSQVRAIKPWKETGLPDQYLASDVRRIALCDFVSCVAGRLIQTKRLDQSIGKANGGWSGPTGGAFSINAPRQEMIPRTSALMSGNESIELRFAVSLPAAGRSVLVQQAYQILAVNLVEIIKQSLLQGRCLITFVANGSVLPRASGASQAPMTGSEVVVFTSPKELEVSLTAITGSTHTGMGIPKSVTMLTGGRLHGKSTLLEALELGVYDHLRGDGREAIVTDPTAFKIRAEDGRSVNTTDVSPFISTLPGGKAARVFSTFGASGSTSMATNI
ncbi:hypothetical protein DOTSEDRAFT_54783 [Dothistroma septosporum NZE10]|uniref:ATPase of the ABC class C-terminal domain-containing protein n=1 Tax=Dothistroma septosporum (strain NZE10 / CBS 128990) TaxID=675120 RepID=N1PJ41_DOTSN|nr:hypothetical protein DOTSEDRAFT_54783 [Dothistroma septosporum NZE10]